MFFCPWKSPMHSPTRPGIPKLLSRPMLFVSGKGGVGNTSVSQAIARAHARAGKKTLWVEIVRAHV